MMANRLLAALCSYWCRVWLKKTRPHLYRKSQYKTDAMTWGGMVLGPQHHAARCYQLQHWGVRKLKARGAEHVPAFT